MSACLSSPITLLAARGGAVSGAGDGCLSEWVGPDLVAALAAVLIRARPEVCDIGW